MYLGLEASTRYLRSLAIEFGQLADVGIFVLPSFPVIPDAVRLLAHSPIAVGAQDSSWVDRGAHTGCVSPAMLRELGCSIVELGHYERRTMFGEDDDMIARKAAAVDRNGLIPLVCVGEVEPDDDPADFVNRQSEAVLSAIRPEASVLFAYEPAWAIGAETSASQSHIEKARVAIDALAAHRPGRTRMLYGGSVSAGGVEHIMRAGLDGVFVGRGALEVPNLARIVREVKLSWKSR